MGVAAVTFDLDDTLVLLDRPRSTILAEASEAVDAPQIPRERYLEEHLRHHANETRTPIFEALLETTSGGDVDATALSTAYREGIGASLQPIPDVEPMLERLGTEYRIALVTNGPTQAQQDKLDRLGWADRFDTVVISGRLGTAKPSTEPFLTACDRLGVKPYEAVHVGNDPVQDVEGALNAGLDAVLVGDEPLEPRSDIPVIHPNRLAEDLPRLLAARCRC